MIDDMDYHITAWHNILTGLGARLTLGQMKEECYGKNSELLERIFPGRFSGAEKETIGYQKEAAYQEAFRPQLKLIDGLHHFLQEAHNGGIKTAIGSAAILFNIDFVLDGLPIRHHIDAIVSADDVAESKPHPETFLKCATLLHTSPSDCLIFEDAPKGVEAAANAGMDCIVITTLHRPDEFARYKNIIFFITDYNDKRIEHLLCRQQN